MSYPWSQTMPYWWHTVAPSGGRGELTGTSVQPDESWASSVTPLGETGGLLDNLSRPPYQSWPEPKSMTALNAGPTAGVDWLGLARKTFEPITSYPATYSQMNQEAREQIGHGVEQLKHVYTPGSMIRSHSSKRSGISGSARWVTLRHRSARACGQSPESPSKI